MSDCMLNMIIRNSDQRLDAILFAEEEYRKAERKISRRFCWLERMKLTRRQNRAVDRLLTAYNEESACSLKILYKQGFKDCICLLKELGVLG